MYSELHLFYLRASVVAVTYYGGVDRADADDKKHVDVSRNSRHTLNSRRWAKCCYAHVAHLTTTTILFCTFAHQDT